MDLSSKKRKADENGAVFDGSASQYNLLPSDARRIMDPLSRDQLLDILQDAACRHPDVLDAVRSLTDGDQSQRKLFIRGLGWDTTTEGLRSLFSTYGELQEAIVIADKATGKSKGYGFITFMHIDGALLALKEPSKKIDGRMTVTQLASQGQGNTGVAAPVQQPGADAMLRKIYVGNVPYDMPSDRLLSHFLSYGEIEEGPLGFDKQTGKSKGYALFVYKTPEAARASLVDPIKTIDGHQMVCKLASEGKKGKPGAPGVPAPGGGVQGQIQGAGGVNGAGDGLGMGGQQSAIPGALSGQYGVPGGISSFGGGLSAAALQGSAGLGQHHALNSSMQSSIGMGTPGMSMMGGQAPSSLGIGSGGFGGGLGSLYGGASQYGSGAGAGAGAGGFGGLGPYQLPQSSAGMPSGSFQEGGHFGLSSSTFQNQQPGSSPGARIQPRGGMYPSLPPYY